MDSSGTANAATVHAGLGVSGAVDAKGQLYMWGFGETCQLGRASEDDAVTPALVPAAGRLAGHKACTSSKVYGMLLPSPQLIDQGWSRTRIQPIGHFDTPHSSTSRQECRTCQRMWCTCADGDERCSIMAAHAATASA